MWCWMTAYSIRKKFSTLVMAEWGQSWWENSKLVPVQVTPKSRREYKHRGRVVGNIGMRPKDQEQIKQMKVMDAAENVYPTPPKQKKGKNNQLHSLNDALDSSRPLNK